MSLLSNIREARQASLANYYSRMAPQVVHRFLGPVFRTTAILCADDDGGRALGELKNGVVSPTAPNLASPGGRNYIQDWIDLANDQLAISGARFRVGNPKYLLVKNTALNSVYCGNSSAADAYAKQPQNKNLFDNTLVLIFRWGPGDSDHPNLQGCGDIGTPYISMPTYDFNGDNRDGHRVYGNNLFTHELGHYMGLVHTMPSAEQIFWNYVGDINKNPKRLPYAPQYLSQMVGVTAEDMATAKAQALQDFALWGPWSLDQDQENVHDTPVDLGTGLPMIMGDLACSGDHTYQLKRYPSNDIDPVYDSDGKLSGFKLKPGVPESDQYLETVTTNEAVRLNIMSYWRCDPECMIFSSDQVAVMNSMLDDPRRSTKYTKAKLVAIPKHLPPGEEPPKKPKGFMYDPISPTELANIAQTLRKSNPKAYALQFEPKPFPQCAVIHSPHRLRTPLHSRRTP